MTCTIAWSSFHRLVVVPWKRHGSLARRAHTVDVSAPGARVTSSSDRQGNLVVRVSVGVVPEAVEFTMAAVIERHGPVADATLPITALHDRRLLRTTRRTVADATLRELAMGMRAEACDDLEFAERACALVHARIAYEYGFTSVSTTAAEAFALGRGVCQDQAHVMLALCRAVGVPARYVSGHLLGDGGTHAWVEVVLTDGDRARALPFDPCNGCRAGNRHLPVATGRDYADVAPTSGSYSGTATGRLSATKELGVTAAV